MGSGDRYWLLRSRLAKGAAPLGGDAQGFVCGEAAGCRRAVILRGRLVIGGAGVGGRLSLARHAEMHELLAAAAWMCRLRRASVGS